MKAWSRSIVGRSALYGPMWRTCAARPSPKRSNRSSVAAGSGFFFEASGMDRWTISSVTMSGCMIMAVQLQFDLSSSENVDMSSTHHNPSKGITP